MVQLNQRLVSERLIVSLSLAILLVVLACFYAPFLTNRASFYIFDFTYGWQANLTYAAQQIAQGHLPLWNPYLMCGIPQLTIAAATPFYLPLYLFVWLPFNQSMAILLSAQQMLAAVGVFVLLRSYGALVVPALLGACAYGLGGLMFSAQVSYTYQASVAVIPWCLWSFRCIGASDISAGEGRRAGRAAGGRGRRAALIYTMIAAVLVAALLAPSVIELAGGTLLVLFMYALADAGRAAAGSKHLRPLRTLALRLTALAAGLVLAAPFILPLLQWLPLSERAGGVSATELLSWSGTWYDFLLLLLPHPLGDLYDNRNLFILMPEIISPPWLGTAYLGSVLSTFSLCGFLRLPRRRQLGCALLLAVLALYILGRHTPASELLVQLHLPFRYPIKFMYFLVALLIALAVKGCQDWLQGDLGTAARVAAFIWLCLLAAGVALSMPPWAAALSPVVAPHDIDLGTGAVRACALDMTVAAGIGLLTALSMVVTSRQHKPHKLAFSFLLLATLLIMYLGDAFDYGRHPGPADFFTRTAPLASQIQSAAAALPSNGSYARFAGMYKDPAHVVHGQQLVDWTVSNYEHVRQMLVSPNNLPFRLGSVVAFGPGTSGPLYACAQHALGQWRAHGDAGPLESFCRLTACNLAVTESETVSFNQAIASLPMLDPRRFQLISQSAVDNYRLYKLTEPTSRAFFAPKVAWGKPHSAVVDLMINAYERGFDPERLTVLEHVRPNETGPRIDVTGAQLSASSVKFVHDESETVELDVRTPVENYLVLLDQNYPGWQASIDGRPTTIYTANAAFRSVLVPAGQHRIRFEFHPI